MATLTLTAEQRNTVWGLLHFTYAGAAESLVNEKFSEGEADQLGDWLYALVALGYEEELAEDVTVEVCDQFLRVLNATFEGACEFLHDQSPVVEDLVRDGDPAVFAGLAESLERSQIDAALTIRELREQAEVVSV